MIKKEKVQISAYIWKDVAKAISDSAVAKRGKFSNEVNEILTDYAKKKLKLKF